MGNLVLRIIGLRIQDGLETAEQDRGDVGGGGTQVQSTAFLFPILDSPSNSTLRYQLLPAILYESIAVTGLTCIGSRSPCHIRVKHRYACVLP